jgi:hypothetical protein
MMSRDPACFTHRLVFAAAEKVFRPVKTRNETDIGIRESAFLPPMQSEVNAEFIAAGDAKVCLPLQHCY